MQPVLFHTIRGCLSVALVYSATVKAVEVQGFTFLLESGSMRFVPYAEYLAISLIALELAFGVLLFSESFGLYSVWGAVVLLIVYTLGIFFDMVYPVSGLCGCAYTWTYGKPVLTSIVRNSLLVGMLMLTAYAFDKKEVSSSLSTSP